MGIPMPSLWCTDSKLSVTGAEVGRTQLLLPIIPGLHPQERRELALSTGPAQVYSRELQRKDGIWE